MTNNICAKKNIFIGGAARAGKSTIAEKISENNVYNHLPVDYIAKAFKVNFPECGINDGVIIDDGSIKLSLFLSTVIEEINRTNEKFIIDSAHVMPKDIIPYLDKEKWDIYFIGYPNSMAEEKFNIIRKCDSTTSWTRHFDDERMLELIKGLIEISKKIEEQCREYNINFNDIIEQTVEEILKKNKDEKL